MTAIDAYVRDLHHAMGGSRRSRTPEIVTEAHDHLLDAAESWERRGYAREVAERRAIEEFGDIEQLAPGYRSVAAIGIVRRTAWVLVVTMMIQPFVWDARDDGTEHGSGLATTLKPVIEMVGGSMIAAGVVAALLCTYGVRWWGVRTWMVRGAAVAMGLGALVVTALAAVMACTGDASTGDALLFLTLVALPLLMVLGHSARSIVQVRSVSAHTS
ncbi:permease prefix domain 1-containing protein [Luteipulveratus halotolerans]|uniref:permease prefix domain 1-containing protein n=1 Tax=Luteipulveratus halotolerans TaxID=1631356 RepID=UPI0006800EE0|nr:permease prefix domain 1-containing protein [Luteipulveratus halotolerans]